MATLTSLAATPGVAAKRPALGIGGTPKKFGVYTLAFDASYPTGGESISSIWNDFKTVEFIAVSGPGSRTYEVDYSGKKVLLYTAIGTEATDTSNQSTITVKLLVVGT